jgi:hypothetical protein
MNKRLLYILMVLFAILSIVFCLMTWQVSLSGATEAAAWDATATYGAEQFHIQLTAVARGASAGGQ